MDYEYPPPVLDELAEHGIRPLPTTPPEVIRDYLSDMYRYEIRRLKRRLLAGEFPQSEYNPRIIELRKRYPLLSIPTELWVKHSEKA